MFSNEIKISIQFYIVFLKFLKNLILSLFLFIYIGTTLKDERGEKVEDANYYDDDDEI